MGDKRVYLLLGLSYSKRPKGNLLGSIKTKLREKEHGIALPKKILLTQVSGPTHMMLRRKIAKTI